MWGEKRLEELLEAANQGSEHILKVHSYRCGEVFLEVVARQLPVLNGINLATAFHRLAKCSLREQRAITDQVFQDMVRLVELKADRESYCQVGALKLWHGCDRMAPYLRTVARSSAGPLPL